MGSLDIIFHITWSLHKIEEAMPLRIELLVFM